MAYDISNIRAHFPSLAVTDNGQRRVYLDNPGGTQVAQHVIDRTVEYFTTMNANGGGPFRTSVDSDALLDEAHAAMADLLHAPSPDEIIFGPNMTTLTLSISRSLARTFAPGDEIILTRMDHDANASPWLLIAEDHDLTIKWLPFDTTTYRYDLDVLDSLLTPRTRLAAINYASNALGTINDVKTITEKVQAAGALSYIDAVQYVPHGITDVQEIGCDFLVCSAYKFYGPHQGILWGRGDLLRDLTAYRVRPAGETLPIKFETGTQVHECIAGTLGVVEYLASIGANMAEPRHFTSTSPSERRQQLVAGMNAIVEYEHGLCRQLIEGLQRIRGLTIHGITDLDRLADRVPTVSFTLEGHHPAAIAKALAQHNIFVWDGDYYAVEVIGRLGLADQGGMLRVGIGHYNTADEIDQLLEVVGNL